MPRLAPQTSATRLESPRSMLLLLADVGVGPVEPVFARRREHVEVERVLQGLGLVAQPAGNQQHLTGEDVHMLAARRLVRVLAEPEAQPALENVGDLLVVMLVCLHDRAFLEVYLRNHRLLGGEYA